MAGTKYKDTTAANGVLATIYNNPSLLEEDGRHFFKKEDFTDELHQVLLGIFQRLYLNNGVKKFSIPLVEDMLQQYPESWAIYKVRRGVEWLQGAEEGLHDTSEGFEFYYQTLKKYALLREYEKLGLKVSKIFDPNELDLRKRQEQAEKFNEMTLEEIALTFENELEYIHQTCIDNALDESSLLSEGMEDLLYGNHQKINGMPFYGKYMDCVTGGMQKGKLFIRSAATGVGKTRSMVADACYLACDEIYVMGGWQDNEDSIPCLFIATEQEKYEIQTMALAFISGVDEDKIKGQRWNDFDGPDAERIKHALEVFQRSKIYIECIPDFSTKDIENCIKRHLTNPLKQVQYVFFDYIFTSPKMMREMKNELGAMREDQVLSWFSTKLKEICVKYNVFILTSTQLNKDWKDSHVPDQNLLRGAKSIADKCDWGAILLDVTEEDQEIIQSYVDDLNSVSREEISMPNVKMSIYKNRGSQFTKGYLWMYANKATCRFDGLFWTGYDCKPNLTVKNDRFSKRKAG